MIIEGIGLQFGIDGQCAVFADHHAVALLDKFLHPGQRLVHGIIILLGAPCRGAGNAFRTAVGPGIIIMHGNQQLVFRRIGGHFEAVITGLLNVGTVAGDQQEAGGIIAAGLTHRIHKGLVHFIGQGIPFVIGQVSDQRIAAIQGRILVKPGTDLFIGSFKNHIVGIIPEIFGDLLPHTLVGFHGQGPGFRFFGAEHAPPAAIPVIVDDHIHTGIAGIIHNFLHTGQIRFIQGVIPVRQVGSIGHPCHRNADGIKARFLHGRQHFLGGHRLAPAHFISRGGLARIAAKAEFPGIAGFHGVAKVCAVAHQPGQLHAGQSFPHHTVIPFSRTKYGAQHQQHQHCQQPHPLSFAAHFVSFLSNGSL